jgi:F-type H+-transporting ATPase subunit gamma
MSGKLSEVESRIGTVHQLEAVITAMRGSAAARSREACSRLDGIRAYAAAIGAAIGQALALAPESEPQPRKPHSPERHVVIVLSSEQGFAGTFNERVLDAAERHLKADGSELLIIGDRGAMVAAERGCCSAGRRRWWPTPRRCRCWPAGSPTHSTRASKRARLLA